eukprot:4367619-Prymnesium_polylepis.1
MLSCSRATALFQSFDEEGRGTISYHALNRMLRSGNNVKLDKKLQAGAAGKILLKAENKSTLRKAGQLVQAGSRLALRKFKFDPELPMGPQIRDALTKNAVRVIDLFHEWDEDQSGSISRKEFRKALPALGIEAPKADVDAFFAQIDADSSGTIEIAEINRMLRAGGAVEIDAKLQAGAMGEIDLESKNKNSIRSQSGGARSKLVGGLGGPRAAAPASARSARAATGCNKSPRGA